MTALAEAQVKTEDSTERLNVAMAELARSQRDLMRQFEKRSAASGKSAVESTTIAVLSTVRFTCPERRS